jgi:hypothetical protein
MLAITKHIAITGVLCAAFAGLAPVATAHDCSYDGVAGRYGFTSSGSIVSPAVGPFVAVGEVTFTRLGTITGSQVTSIAGTLFTETIEATYTVNPDCTGSATVSIYHGSTLARTTDLHIVWDQHQTEARGLFLRAGTAISISAHKMFGDD